MQNKFISLLYILTFLQAYTISAKNDSTSIIKNGIGLSFAPIVSNTNHVNYATTTNVGRLGCTSALCENIVLSKKQNFFLYTELGYQSTAYAHQVPVISLGNGNSGSYSFYQKNKYGYFSLSMQKVVLKISKKVNMFVGIGAQLNYCYSITQTTNEIDNINGKTINNNLINTTYNIPQQNLWAAAGVIRVGLLANMAKHLTLNITPVFYAPLNPKYVFVQNNPGYYCLGLNLQIMYGF